MIIKNNFLQTYSINCRLKRRITKRRGGDMIHLIKLESTPIYAHTDTQTLAVTFLPHTRILTSTHTHKTKVRLPNTGTDDTRIDIL